MYLFGYFSKEDKTVTMKDFRARHNLTQEQLAESLGVSRITIARIEAGAVTVKIETVLRMMEIYGVNLRDALTILNARAENGEINA